MSGCCSLQLLPKAATLGLKGRSSKYCGFQKCTLQFKDAAATLISITGIIAEMEKHSLGSRIEQLDVMTVPMPGCPGLAKEGVSVHLPKHGLLG